MPPTDPAHTRTHPANAVALTPPVDHSPSSNAGPAEVSTSCRWSSTDGPGYPNNSAESGSSHCHGSSGVRLDPPAPARMPPPWPKPHLSGPPPLPGFAPFDGPGARSPLARWLLDPGGYLRDTAGWWCSALLVYGPIAGAGAILATIAGVSLRRLLNALRLARWRARARWVLIMLPLKVEAEGGQRLWEALHSIACPWLTRWRHGQPHVGFEIHARPGRIVIGMWVPSVIPTGLVEHAIRGAWPGVEVDITYADIPDPAPPPPDGQTRIMEGTRLVLGRHAALPLRAHHTSDPLRSVLASLHHLSEGQTACIQILARPLTGGLRVSLARRAAIRMATSPTVSPSLLAMNSTGPRVARLGLGVGLAALSVLVRLLLDVISPTTLATTGPGRAPRRP